MAYIRWTSAGQYVETLQNSDLYVYSPGQEVSCNGRLYDQEEFAGLLDEVAAEVSITYGQHRDIRNGLKNEFGGIEYPEHQEDYPMPEMLEILCRILDRSSQNFEFDEEFQERINEIVEQKDS